MQTECESYVMVRELHHLNEEYQLAPTQLKMIILTDIRLIEDALSLLNDETTPTT
ncbi:hypothetical protein [Sporosarcina gallistercoris]|uniref:Spo0E family sporulation regulatory protein-aspartic acid phosphatase n=1 Tax=Sporosarcina gallistercoris TaxID=2762245 RepID=A0ABR8PHR1_9BACL|nr:hypothetical protein [Sporosarcina gallistercoris]MBD7907683.1 hypothetical protein [Sporosarcina gallistercoris]